jgi:hypothetical protein
MTADFPGPTLACIRHLSHQARAADTPAKPAKSSANMSALMRSKAAAGPGAVGSGSSTPAQASSKAAMRSLAYNLKRMQDRYYGGVLTPPGHVPLWRQVRV